MKRNKAFTLSETLAALAIIGIISALTIPPIQQNATKHTNAQLLKKTIYTLNASIENAMVEKSFRSSMECYTDTNTNSPNTQGCKALYETLQPYLRITKKCDNSNDKCYINNYNTIILENGISIGFDKRSYALNLLVDVNGAKGPDKLDVDRFNLILKGEHGRMPAYDIVSDTAKSLLKEY